MKKRRRDAVVLRRGGTKEQVRQSSISIFLKTVVQVSLKFLEDNKYSVYEEKIAAFQFFRRILEGNFALILILSHVGG